MSLAFHQDGDDVSLDLASAIFAQLGQSETRIRLAACQLSQAMCATEIEDGIASPNGYASMLERVPVAVKADSGTRTRTCSLNRRA